MSTKYLILASHYTRGMGVPDYSHGEVYPGPYDTRDEAMGALTTYVREEIAPSCQGAVLAVHHVCPVEIPETRNRSTPSALKQTARGGG